MSLSQIYLGDDEQLRARLQVFNSSVSPLIDWNGFLNAVPERFQVSVRTRQSRSRRAVGACIYTAERSLVPPRAEDRGVWQRLTPPARSPVLREDLQHG